MPDEPIAQVEIESEILRLSSLCEKVTHEIARRAMAAAEADANYRKAHASAYLMTSGTVGVRDAETALVVADDYLARRTTEALLLSARSAGENYRAQLSALQTLASNQRALVSR